MLSVKSYYIKFLLCVICSITNSNIWAQLPVKTDSNDVAINSTTTDTSTKEHSQHSQYRRVLNSLPSAEIYARLAWQLTQLETPLVSWQQLGEALPWPGNDTLSQLQLSAENNYKEVVKIKSSISKHLQDYTKTAIELQQVATSSAAKNDSLDADLNTQINHSIDKIKTAHDSFKLLDYKVDTVSAQYRTFISTVKERIADNSLIKAGKQEQSLWAAPQNYSSKDVVAALHNNYRDNEQIKKFVKRNEWGAFATLILLSIGFFYWLFKLNGNARISNISVAQLLPQGKVALLLTLLCYTLVFILMLLPVIEPTVPPLMLSWIHCILLLLFLVFLRRQIEQKYRLWWSAFIILYIATSFTNSVLSNALFIRTLALALNVASIIYLIRINLFFKTASTTVKFRKVIVVAFVLVSIIAMFFNIIGKTNIASALNLAAMAGLAQYACVYCFRKLILRSLDIQFSIAQLTGGLFSRLNKKRSVRLINSLVYIFGIYSWMLVMFINTNGIDVAGKIINHLLAMKYSWGSISLTFGNILWCTVILLIANWLQKNIPLFFENQVQSFQQTTERRSSRIALLRLLIIIIAFFLGISALGLSLDKLTVILGALTVGIGLGLQNIFNNFVSGVILIFEKPFRVGDYIELADKKGRVKDIGIRSSILLTKEGSELIIPNGDLLSGRVVNWSVHDGDIQSSFLLKFNSQDDAEKFKPTIMETVANSDFVRKDETAAIFYESVAPDNVTLKVNCRIASLYNEQHFRSELLEKLYKRATLEDIPLTVS